MVNLVPRLRPISEAEVCCQVRWQFRLDARNSLYPPAKAYGVCLRIRCKIRGSVGQMIVSLLDRVRSLKKERGLLFADRQRSFLAGHSFPGFVRCPGFTQYCSAERRPAASSHSKGHFHIVFSRGQLTTGLLFLSPFASTTTAQGSFSLLTPEYLRASGFRATYSALSGPADAA